MSELSPDIIIFPATESIYVQTALWRGWVGGKSCPKDPSTGSEWYGQRTFVMGEGQPKEKEEMRVRQDWSPWPETGHWVTETIDPWFSRGHPSSPLPWQSPEQGRNQALSAGLTLDALHPTSTCT